MAWTIRLKSSRPPAYDHWYLDGHFHLLSGSLKGMAAGQGEIQAEVHRIKSNGMASEQAARWYARSERYKLRQIRLVPANSGAGRKKDMPMVH